MFPRKGPDTIRQLIAQPLPRASRRQQRLQIRQESRRAAGTWLDRRGTLLLDFVQYFRISLCSSIEQKLKRALFKGPLSAALFPIQS